MTCRHDSGNPNCSSYPQWLEEQRNAKILAKAKALGITDQTPTPNSEQFEIVRDQAVGDNLVLMVQYPSCNSCLFEGRKVMVFLGAKYQDAFKWRKIDPHFREPGKSPNREAPSPDARFPATEKGWADALDYANSKSSSRMM